MPGRLYTIEGSPENAKRWLAEKIAVNVAKAGTPVVFLSSYSHLPDLVRRFVATEGGMDLRRLEDCYPKEMEWPLLSAAIGRLADIPLFVAHMGEPSIGELEVHLSEIIERDAKPVLFVEALISGSRRDLSDARRLAAREAVPIVLIAKMRMNGDVESDYAERNACCHGIPDATLTVERVSRSTSRSRSLSVSVVSDHCRGLGEVVLLGPVPP